jgi:iron(III) transport system substrate-binding protein
MNWPRVAIVASLVVLLGVPLITRERSADVVPGARSLIIITPHNEQIRYEFGRAFSQWHERRFGEPVQVIWNAPGGTSEIRSTLLAQYTAALQSDQQPGGAADLVMGGGEFEYARFKRPITITVAGETRSTTITAPVDFDDEWLEATYGENRIGSAQLYDPDKYWFGTALSSFGIVYNRDVLARLGVPEPTYWRDFCNPELIGWVSVGNPAHSGSINKSFDTILQRHGWHEGWMIIRRLAANARSFTAQSLRVLTEVSHGDAAMGVCIDFLGRFEAQAIRESGSGDRVGYVDPPGVSAIDPDPIAMLRGAPNPELAKRFIQFVLSEEGQALWQFPANVSAADELGPERYELRRLPIVRAMYESHFDRFIDRVDPFELAAPIDANLNYWSFIAPMFTAMAIDNHERMQEAWHAITSHPAYPRDAQGLIDADLVVDPVLREMLALFDSMPSVLAEDGSRLSLADDSNLPAIAAAWKKPELWPGEAEPMQVMRVEMTRFFNDQYERIAELARKHE